MRLKVKIGLVVFACSITCLPSCAQETPFDTKSTFSVGLEAHYGSTFFAKGYPEDPIRSITQGLTASLYWQRTDRQIFDKYLCSPRQGLSISYFDYNNSIFGKGVNLAYSLEPHFLINPDFSFFPKISVGTIVLSNPYDPINNPANKAYSLHVNACFSLGVGVRYQLFHRWAINLNTEAHHVSNGGLSDPNYGLNWTTFSFGLEYFPQGLALTKYTQDKTKTRRHRSTRFDLQLFGILKEGFFNGVSAYYPITGINFTTSWQTTYLHAWTLAAELYKDQYSQKSLSLNGINSNGYQVGLMAGHEFLLSKFIFSQQLGFYILSQNTTDFVYHRWGLQYSFLPRWSIGASLLAHRQIADFTDVRVTRVLGKK